MTRKKSIGESIYSGTASFGRAMAVVGVVFAMIAALIMIPLGIYFIVHKTKLTSQTSGTVSGTQGSDQCGSARVDNNNVVYDCTFGVKYSVENKSYNINATTSGPIQYKGGDSVTVYYEPNNPSNGSINSDNTDVIGVVLLVLGIIIPTVAWIWWYFARKSKAVAAAGGVMAGLDILSGGRSGGIL